jgi:hypothetical protein
MTAALAAGVLLLATAARAADLALPPSAAHPAGPFPAEFAATVRLSLAQDSFYGSRLLQAFDARVAAVAAMTGPAQVRDYLTAAAGPLPALKRELGASSIDADRASALLLAHALARPGEFGATLDGLETAKPGLGAKAAGLLSSAHGGGDRRLLAALRAAGARAPQAEGALYGPDGRLQALFDGSRGVTDAEAAPAVSARGYTGYGPGGTPRRSGLKPVARP